MALEDLLNRDDLPEDARELIREEIAVRKQSEKALQESRSVLLNISEAAFRTGTLEELLHVVHREVGRLMDATNFDVALYDEESGAYSYPYFRDERDEPTFSAEEMAHSLTHHVRSTGAPLLVDEAGAKRLEQGTAVRLVGTPSAVWMGAPLRTSKGVIGVIALQSYTDPQAYGQQELEVLSFVSGHIGTLVERKRAELALRESEERFRTLSAASFEGIVVSEGGVVCDVNEQLARMLGYEPLEIVGGSVRDFVAPESRDLVEKHIKSGHEMPYEHLAIRKDGSIFPVEVHGKAMLLKGQQTRVTAIRDITERKRAEEERRELEAQVQHAQKLESLGILAGGVAHDFNNLLVGILGHSSLALGKLAHENPARRNIEGTVRAAERAADLARQMLAYSGHGHFVVEAVDLSALVRENVQLLKAGIAKGAQLRTDLSESPTHIKADMGQIQQVIMNLVINGAEALCEGPGTVTITTGSEVLSKREKRYSRYTATQLQPGSYAFLEVRDDGCGMDEEALSKLFDPFFTTKFVGRGLGLSAVLGIIRGHKGGIDVQSEPGKGTTFRLVFPSTEEAPAAEEVVAPQGPVGGTILVIDDEELVREMTGEMLIPEGLKVLTAEGGAAGLALFRERRSDIGLVLLDFSMPGMGGEETFKELRKIDPDVPIVLSSGFGQEEATRRFEGLGLSGFIQKPYKPDALLAQIRGCLDQGSEDA